MTARTWKLITCIVILFTAGVVSLHAPTVCRGEPAPTDAAPTDAAPTDVDPALLKRASPTLSCATDVHRTLASVNEHRLAPDGTLTLATSFGGGCSAHSVCVGYQIAADGVAEVWLEHGFDVPDLCEAFVRRETSLTLPPDVLAAPHIVLLQPWTDAVLMR